MRQRFVEAVAIGTQWRAIPQMPLAQMHRVVAAIPQQLGQRDFADGQAHVLVGNQFVLALGVVDQWVQLPMRALAGHYLHELFGGRRELESESRGIATGHDGRARRRAGGVSGIAIAELDALPGYAVDVRRRHPAAGDAAAIVGDVVEAQVIGNDQHDVGRTACCATRGRRRPLLPYNLVRRSVVNVLHVFHRQQNQTGAPADGVKAGNTQQEQDCYHPGRSLDHAAFSMCHCTGYHRSTQSPAGSKAGRSRMTSQPARING